MTLGILAFSEGPLSSLGKQDAIAVVTGQALTVGLGAETVGAGTTVVETGQDLTVTLGNETVVTTSVAAVTGEEITSALGSVTVSETANPTVSVSGFGLNFVTGTFAGVIPVISVDGITIGDGTRGPLTESLQDWYALDIESQVQK